ncbi:alkaline phosphatase family protein [Methylobacterium platani]|uniref:Nucleotide pyrophosphatase n=1 Tax=Methylobacterium platani TaxID=427683 RepID=A0A179RYF5_9HYPH|nr:alkaline phosphatase family protein [Methylobacterium platani]OAS15999.1 nucleotide pyrophosphatase [Methylobacterium platani]
MAPGSAAPAAGRPHNVILFVPDGMRSRMVSPELTPAMAALRRAGVDFANSHSLFPTFTTANGASMATGHHLGDTGDFSNTIFTGKPIAAQDGTVTPFVEHDAVLGDMDAAFDGDWLNEETVLRAAARAGYSTAAIGKVGPVLNFDHTNRTGDPTIVVDDQTGSNVGIPLSQELRRRLEAAGLPVAAPSRGENGKAGSSTVPGTLAANVGQQAYFADVATKVVLPLFRERERPFILVYWSRDPDGVQHNEGDSLGRLVPGINGPTSRAGMRNADDNLAALRRSLDALGLAGTTNIVVAADHGFSTITKESATSPSARTSLPDVPAGLLPPGFLALDLARALDLPVFEPFGARAPVPPGSRPRTASALLGRDPADPDVVVAVNGGSDLVYLPKADTAGNAALLRRIVDALAAQDYTSGLFVDDAYGPVPGTLPLSAVNLKGDARTPTPALVVNFRSFTTGCDIPVTCVAEVADTVLQQGQGMHGTFSRADTHNFMAAIGPDFKAGFVDPAPVSNADVGRTLAALLHLDIPAKGRLLGRTMGEALKHGTVPETRAGILRSAPHESGLATVLRYQEADGQRYFDAAGFPGRTFGLD